MLTKFLAVICCAVFVALIQAMVADTEDYVEAAIQNYRDPQDVTLLCDFRVSA